MKLYTKPYTLKKIAGNRSSVMSLYTAEGSIFGKKNNPTAVKSPCGPNFSASFLEQDDVDIIVDTLEKQLALEADNLLPLGCLQGSHQCLKDVGTLVIIK